MVLLRQCPSMSRKYIAAFEIRFQCVKPNISVAIRPTPTSFSRLPQWLLKTIGDAAAASMKPAAKHLELYSSAAWRSVRPRLKPIYLASTSRTNPICGIYFPKTTSHPTGWFSHGNALRKTHNYTISIRKPHHEVCSKAPSSEQSPGLFRLRHCGCNGRIRQCPLWCWPLLEA